MKDIVVNVENLSYIYPDKTCALEDINFTITEGESVAVIGGNGAGKSTLLKLLNGSMLSTNGVVEILNQQIAKANLVSIHQAIGMVFQDPDDQLFMPTVFDDVAFGPLNLGLPQEDVISRVDEALSAVGMEKLTERAPHHLSGGEKRRVAIATILAMEPAILAMDEPSAGLDPASRRMLINLLNSFNHTKIIASHDLDMIAEVCDRTLVISNGKLEADGPTKDIFQNKSLLKNCSLEQPLSMQNCSICKRYTK